jgi:hypothetical protein
MKIAAIPMTMVLAVLAASTQDPAANTTPANPLEVAQRLSQTTFAGFSYEYDGKAADKKTDCTQFLLAVVEASLGKKMSRTGKESLLIQGVQNLDDAIKDRAESIRGVHTALIRDEKVGENVPLDKLQPGDLVQYWYRGKKKGKEKQKDPKTGEEVEVEVLVDCWLGHAGIVEKVVSPLKGGKIEIQLFGAHKSKGTIATLDQKLTVDGVDKSHTTRLFAVRITASSFKPVVPEPAPKKPKAPAK